jgi:hypothetical protein
MLWMDDISGRAVLPRLKLLLSSTLPRILFTLQILFAAGIAYRRRLMSSSKDPNMTEPKPCRPGLFP